MISPRRRFEIALPDGRSLDLGQRTLVMGVLNVTPDSFSDGGRFYDPARAADTALSMAGDGADVIDIGGESTRPGAADVAPAEERRRIVPVIAAVVRQTRVPVSVDTRKSEVADAALDAGAAMVNDVSALGHDPRLGPLVAERRVPVVLMHTRGGPREMTGLAAYHSVVDEVAAELGASLERARTAGVADEAVLLDPGIGFAKRAEHSLEVLARLDAAPLAALGRPWLLGPSRKSFLQAALGECAPLERDWGTAAAVTACVFAGAHVVRVHLVREMVQVVRVADMIRAARRA